MAGCDSIVTLDLTIFRLEALFEQSRDTTDGYALTIINKSVGNTMSFLWEFGDGGTATEITPDHTYPEEGTYYLCLSVTDINNCTEQYCDSITVLSSLPQKNSGLTINVLDSTTSIHVSVEPDIAEAKPYLKIYPNPTKGLFIVGTEVPGTLTITNIVGAVMYSNDIDEGLEQIDLNEQPPGVYFVIFRNGHNVGSYRVIIQR